MPEVTSLADVFERHGGRDCLIDAPTGRTLSYDETWMLAARAGAEMVQRGLRCGDRIAVAAPNSVNLAIVYLGALFAGIVVVPLGAGFGRRELRSILERAKPSAILSGPGFDRATRIGVELGIPAWTLDTDGFDPSRASGGDRVELGAWEHDDVVAIHFTSGTTGPPRGVGHRLGDFLGNAERFGSATGLGEANRFYADLPMTYLAGYYNLLLLPLALGAAIVVDHAFDARSLLAFWKTAAERQVDTIWFVPMMMAMLMEIDRDPAGAAYCREQLRFAAVGTASLTAELRQRFEQRYGITTCESYGLAETLLLTTATPRMPASPGAVGRPLEGVELRIDQFDGIQGHERDGLILVDSPDTMVGYLRRYGVEQPFVLPLVDGRWLETGDLGLIDDAGELRITGREKEVIIRGGVNISPIEIERVLRSHRGVADAAVVGVPHEIFGEDIVAVVTCKPGVTLNAIEEELRAEAKAQLDIVQQPGTFVQIDELPTTSTGKVRKAALRDLVIDHLGLSPQTKGFMVDLERGADPTMQWRQFADALVVDLTGAAGRDCTQIALPSPSGGLPFKSLVGPAIVVRLPPAGDEGEIRVEDLRAVLGTTLVHPRILLSTRSVGLQSLSREACLWLLDQGLVLLGIASPATNGGDRGHPQAAPEPNRELLLSRGAVIVERLEHLDELASPEVFLVALPATPELASSSPARVVALEVAR